MTDKTQRELAQLARGLEYRRRVYLARYERLRRIMEAEQAAERARWRFRQLLGMWALSRRRGRKIRKPKP